MYFSFFKPQDWRKRSVVRGRGFIQRFPSIYRNGCGRTIIGASAFLFQSAL